jgi:hypothetical protein
MKQLKKLKAKLRSNKDSSHNPANPTGSTSLAQQGSGSTPSASPFPKTLHQNPRITSSESSSGLLARATHVEANHSVFIDIGGDQYNAAGNQYIVKAGMQVCSQTSKIFH